MRLKVVPLPDLLEAIRQLDLSDTPAVMFALAGRIASAKAETIEPATPPDETGDTMLSTDQAAAMLGRSTKWLYRRRAALPFARKLGNRSYVFSRNGLQRWLERQKG
jgi:predicted DNA-binding transcriptional regulator AlpA